MTLETGHRAEPSPVPSHQDLEDEYRRLLSYQKSEELRAFARRWGVRLNGTRKASIVDQLAGWLNDPHVIRGHLHDLDDLGLQILTYLHLTLSPEYGLSADNIVRGVIRQQERTEQQAKEKELLPPEVSASSRAPAEQHHAAIQEQIAILNRRGLLLPFRQGNATYYSLPTAVRLCLPPRPELFATSAQPDLSEIQEITLGRRIQALYAVWMALAGGRPNTGKPLSPPPLPPRQEIENTWITLRDWNNDPEEISTIAAGQHGRSRPDLARLGQFSASALNWALTVVAPPRRLSDDDLAFVSAQTGRPAPEIEFCYVLLEAFGALSGAPGQPVSIHKEAMYRFLRSPLADKVRALWQAWTTNEAWSEMEMVLRGVLPRATALRALNQDTAPMRLRRSLAYPDFKPADLYREWRVARQALLRFLFLLEEEQWVSIDGFLRAVYTVHPDLLHHQTDSSVWRLESPKTGKQFGATIDDWLQGQGRFVLAILQGPLYWLGLVRLGYSSAESLTPTAFQLTPAGVFALGKQDALSGEAFDAGQAPACEDTGTAVCSVSDDLKVTLLPGQAPTELYDLVHTVGSLVEAAPDRFVYRLTASGVLRWAEAAASRGNGSTPDGDTADACAARSKAVETLIATLSEYCAPPGTQSPVAADWQRELRTWAENYGRLHVYEDLTLLELADDYALQELLASTPLQEHIVYQFSPRLVAIRGHAVDELVEQMEIRGYTPRVK
jgi:hypothetical protein